MLRIVFYICLLLLTGAAPAGHLSAAGLAAEAMKTAGARQLSHRAVYVLALAPKAQRSRAAWVDGRMVMEWRETCDGYISEQRIVTSSVDEAGDKSVSDISASSWEALDGTLFRFSMRQRLDNELVQEYEGSAKLAASGGPGAASMRKPAPKEIKLPAGVVFASGHMQALLNAARAGQHHDSRPLFDGTSDSDYYQVVSSIGAVGLATTQERANQQTETDPGKLSIIKAIEGLPWWPVQISYYGLDSNEGMPEFEIAFRLYDNGVSTGVTLDYGSFALSGTLSRIEAFEPPDC